MELYIGGYAQGKLEYVKTKYPDAIVFDETNARDLLSASKEKLNAKETIVFNHFHLVIKKMLNNGNSVERIEENIIQLLKQNPNPVIISDEIGNGIVPMEQSERLYRESTGRLLIEIAKKADRVERIICGIPQRIK